MKIRLSLWFLSCILFSFISCTKELSRENGTPVVTQQAVDDFYATVGSAQWNADSVQQVSVSNGGVSISGISKTGVEISIILPQFNTGTFALNAQSTSYALYANLIDSIPSIYISNQGTASGSVTITSIDTVNKVVSGTFQFTLVSPIDNSTVTITKGAFDNVPYTGNSSVVVVTPPGSADTLYATIDGSLFNSAQVVYAVQNGELIVAGISADGSQTIDLAMPASVSPGSYTFNIAGALYFAAYSPSATIPLVSQTGGTLTIISNNVTTKRIQGAFSFEASSSTLPNTANLTNGYFSLNY